MTNIKLATVTEVTDDGIKVVFDGEDTASNKYYKFNNSITFNVGDRVVCFYYSGTYIVGFKIKE